MAGWTSACARWPARPSILWLIKEAGAAGESLPGNRGELYARFVSRMLRRDTDRRHGCPDSRSGSSGRPWSTWPFT